MNQTEAISMRCQWTGPLRMRDWRTTDPLQTRRRLCFATICTSEEVAAVADDGGMRTVERTEPAAEADISTTSLAPFRRRIQRKEKTLQDCAGRSCGSRPALPPPSTPSANWGDDSERSEQYHGSVGGERLPIFHSPHPSSRRGKTPGKKGLV